MANPSSSSDRLPASSDGEFYLPGATSEDQYAILPAKAPNGSARTTHSHSHAKNSPEREEPNRNAAAAVEHYTGSSESTEKYAKINKQQSATPPPEEKPDYVNVEPDALRTPTTRKETMEYESLVYISDVLQSQPTPPSQQASSIDYETIASPPSDANEAIRGRKSTSGIVSNEIISTSSPRPGELVAKLRLNPFISPVKPFTAPKSDSTAPPPPTTPYTELDKEAILSPNLYQSVNTGSEDIYEPIATKRSTGHRHCDDDYEPVEVRERRHQCKAEAEVDEDSFFSDLESDEMIEERSGEEVPGLKLREVDKGNHLLLPRFSVATTMEELAERRRSNLPENPYLSHALMEKITTSIKEKRWAILPPMPTGLNRDETKRYLILDTILSTERSYVDSLRQLIDVYATPLASQDGRHGGVALSAEKIKKIFYKLQEIWMHHNMFLIALSSRISDWHPMVKIGDIFEGSFNKRLVADDYTDYVNNFETAMETLNTEIAHSTSFRRFLQECQVMSHDKLDIKSLLLKPVQRFPQFILCLQDMLRYCGVGHPDRVSLQLALTRLEFLADTLNERKRAIEARSYVRELDKRITNLERPLQQQDRGFVRLDFVEQQVKKKGKIAGRRCCLFMLTDSLVCASLLKPKEKGSYRGKYKFKWTVPLSVVQVIDVDFVLEQRRMELKTKSGKSAQLPFLVDGDEGLDARSSRLRSRRDDCLADFGVVSQISGLVAVLKNQYKILDLEKTRHWCQRLQEKIVLIEEKIREQEGSRLDLLLPSHRQPGSEAVYTFIMESTKNRESWLVGLHTTLLKQRKQNNPGWLVPGEDDLDNSVGSADLFSLPTPLFDAGLRVCPGEEEATVSCGVACEIGSGLSGRVVWVCSEKGDEGLVSVLREDKLQVNVVETFSATTSTPLCAAFVVLKRRYGQARPTVWIGTRSGKIFIYGAHLSRPGAQRRALLQIACSASTRDIAVCGEYVFAALGDGKVSAYNIDAVSKKVNNYRHSTVSDSLWDPRSLVSLALSGKTTSVSSLSPAKDKVWCASGRTITAICAKDLQIESSFAIDSNDFDIIDKVVSVGVGVWLSLHGSASIQLYHTETRQLLQSVGLANVMKRLPKENPHLSKRRASARYHTGNPGLATTSLLAAHNRLWVGLSDGHVVALPVARLGGVPLTTDRGSVSVHRFREGPVRFLLSAAPPTPAPSGAQRSFRKEGEDDGDFDGDSPLYVSFPDKEGEEGNKSQLPPPPTPPRGPDVSAGERSWPAPPEPIAEKSIGGEDEYDIPWDLLRKSREEKSGAPEPCLEESSDLVRNATDSILCESEKLEADAAEKTLEQVRGEKASCGMVLAGGEGYTGSDERGESDYAGVLVWRVDW